MLHSSKKESTIFILPFVIQWYFLPPNVRRTSDGVKIQVTVLHYHSYVIDILEKMLPHIECSISVFLLSCQYVLGKKHYDLE